MKQIIVTAVAAAVVLGFAGAAEAQTYSLTVTGPAQAAEGAAFDAALILDFTGDPMAGFSYGVCNDPAFTTLTGRVDGAAIGTLNGGGGPDFNEVSEFADGYTAGLVICFTGCNPLPAGNDLELAIGSYSADAEVPSTSVETCDTLGNPPVATVVVVNGASVTPDQIGLAVEIVGVPDPAYTYSVADVAVDYNADDGLFSFDTAVSIDQDDNGAPDALTQGFSMGLSHETAVLEVTGVVTTLAFSPDFAEIGLSDPNGWTIGCVYSFTGATTAVLQDTEVITASYQNAAGAPLGTGMEQTVMTDLLLSDNVGTPPVANVVVVAGASLTATFDDASITLTGTIVQQIPFRRGDANGDGTVNIADGIWILNDLFQNGPTTTDTCEIANDVNDDSVIDSSDAVYIFNYRFLNGPAPVAPFPDCGTTPTQLPSPDDCSSYGAC